MLIANDRCRRLALVLPVALGLGVLSGCAAEVPPTPGTDRFVAEPIRLTHHVVFADKGDEITSAQQYELAKFLDEIDPDRRAEVFLDATGPLKDDRVESVAGFLQELGWESAGGGGGHGVEQGVTVTVLEDVILPEACFNSDDWPDPRLPPASCTNALSLVRMMEEPDDLVSGRTLSPSMSARAAAAAVALMKRKAASQGSTAAAGDGDAPSNLPPSSLTRDASY